MSYEDQDRSVEGGQPFTLFLFRYGPEDNHVFAYTDVDQIVYRDEVAYLPTTIGRQSVEESGNLDQKTMEIDISPRSTIVQFYRERTPPSTVSLTIWAGHLTDPAEEARVVWKGRVLSVESKRPFSKINAEPLDTTLKRAGLRRHYQRGCPHVLYKTACGADRETLKLTPTILSVGNNFVELASGFGGAVQDRKYISGYVEWVNEDDGLVENRTILSAVEDGSSKRLVLNGKTNGLLTTTTLSLFAGCNHRRGDCNDLHGQIVSFGGQFAIPRQNPFGYVNRFY